LQKDLIVGMASRVVIYTTFMLALLSKCKFWYVDGTFKAVQRPFTQLFSVHSFIQQDSHIKQIPLYYVIMLSWSTDYKAVMTFLREKMTNSSLKSVVLDFEAAAVVNISDIFPDATLCCCGFHWVQAMKRKINELGLAPKYRKKNL
jgi:hypothetical protein